MAKAKQSQDSTRKDRKKGAVGAVLSATAGPAIRKWFEQAAVSLPEDHWIRNSELFKRGFPALTTWLENTSDELPMWVGVIVEQLIDGTDAFQAVLESSTKKDGPPSTAESSWIKQFKSDAPKRFRDAANKEEELRKIQEEFELLQKLEEFMKTQEPPAPVPPPTKTLGESITPTITWLADFFEERATKKGR